MDLNLSLKTENITSQTQMLVMLHGYGNVMGRFIQFPT